VVDEQAQNGVAHVRFFCAPPEDRRLRTRHPGSGGLPRRGGRLDRWRARGCIECAGGSIPLRVSLEHGTPVVELRHSVKDRTPAGIPAAKVGIALGATRIRNDLPLEIVSTGLQHLVVPVLALADLSAFRLDAPIVGELATRCGADPICM